MLFLLSACVTTEIYLLVALLISAFQANRPLARHQDLASSAWGPIIACLFTSCFATLLLDIYLNEGRIDGVQAGGVGIGLCLLVHQAWRRARKLGPVIRSLHARDTQGGETMETEREAEKKPGG